MPAGLAGTGSTMKFQPDHLDGVNAVSRLEGHRVWIHASAHEHSVLVPWRGDVQPWPVCRLADLQPEHFDSLVAMAEAGDGGSLGIRVLAGEPRTQQFIDEGRLASLEAADHRHLVVFRKLLSLQQLTQDIGCATALLANLGQLGL